ncbi:MAG: hypothetical protein J2P28_21020 [Actinobacteria bacterium]|nr:hypothetical protein [Actinomycetota bacterium]
MADNLYGEALTTQVRLVCARPVIVVVLAPTDEAVVERELERGGRAYGHWMKAWHRRHNEIQPDPPQCHRRVESAAQCREG